MSEHLALENITILDLTRVIAGPYCGAMLADLGANVIKIELPGRGDDARAYGPYVNGESLYYGNLNRNKKGITLNLKSPEGKEIFKKLAAKADVVLENYRPGVMDKLGLDMALLPPLVESWGTRCSARSTPGSSTPPSPASAATAGTRCARAMTSSPRRWAA